MSAFGLFSVGVSALGWCLVHFVWQAAAVGALYASVRMLLPRGNPRYLAAMLALLVMAACPFATAWHEVAVAASPIDLAGVTVTGSAMTAPSSAAALSAWRSLLDAALPWLVLLWAAGVGVLGVRVFRQWRGLRAMLRMAENLPGWQARARRFAERLGLRRAVPVLASVRVATPTLVGWVRPAVVLPLALLARMPAAQIDMVLAHELAHLKRLDHVANLFQVVVETLFFYHPVVHWISREARNERELCCDALALRVTGCGRREFVAALAGLEEFRAGHADLALAASGGILVERAWFIAGAMPARRRGHAGLATICLAVLGAALALGVAWRQDRATARGRVLAVNGAALRQSLAGLVNVPVPQVHDVPGRRPNLLPVSFTTIPLPARATVAPSPRVPAAVALSPMLAVLDIEPALSGVAPIAVAPPAAASETATTPVSATPRAIRTVAPDYPAQALLEGVQGRVEIQFALSATGVPEDLRVVDASASGRLDAAALHALSRWRFMPPATPGRQYRQTFNFRLGTGAREAAVTQDCLPATGTHICRRIPDAGPGAKVLRPKR